MNITYFEQLDELEAAIDAKIAELRKKAPASMTTCEASQSTQMFHDSVELADFINDAQLKLMGVMSAADAQSQHLLEQAKMTAHDNMPGYDLVQQENQRLATVKYIPVPPARAVSAPFRVVPPKQFFYSSVFDGSGGGNVDIFRTNFLSTLDVLETSSRAACLSIEQPGPMDDGLSDSTSEDIMARRQSAIGIAVSLDAIDEDELETTPRSSSPRATSPRVFTPRGYRVGSDCSTTLRHEVLDETFASFGVPRPSPLRSQLRVQDIPPIDDMVPDDTDSDGLDSSSSSSGPPSYVPPSMEREVAEAGSNDASESACSSAPSPPPLFASSSTPSSAGSPALSHSSMLPPPPPVETRAAESEDAALTTSSFTDMTSN